MLFNSLTFLVFFVTVLALFRLLPGWRGRKWLLLVASYLFYAAWSPPLVALLVASSAIDWFLARQIDAAKEQSRRRLFLVASIAVNLVFLGYFKYGDFLLNNFTLLLAQFNIRYVPAAHSIVLPLGISFYTFASLSYIIDVYRRQMRADCPFVDYALFVSFFPHLVAGPIVRGSCLLPQLAAPRLPTREMFGWGLVLLCLGLFAKVVLADAILSVVVDEVYAAPGKFGAADIWAAVLAFSGQIYFDFSGYSLCAIGIALCFGFSFPDNFLQPYGARGFSDFWRRWHVSLSSWLRDYLYVSIGGNRGGEWKTVRNLMLTMLIGGLWHGASWMFVLWGGLHGLFLVIERILVRPATSGIQQPAIGRTLLTFVCVTLAWIPFRAHDPSIALEVVSGLWRTTIDAANFWMNIMVLVLMAYAVRWQIMLRDRTLESAFGSLARPVQFAMVGGCLLAVFLVSGGDARAFIYFQF